MRYVVIENSIVINAIDAPDGFAPDGMVVAASDTAQKGDSWDGSTFTPAAPALITSAQVDAERDRRIEAGFEFGGKAYQSRVQDQKRIAGAGTLALAAIVAGAQVGNYRWHGGTSDFAWIAADNSLTLMDAQTVLAFGQTAAQHETMHVFAGKALKSMDPIPQDYTADAFWP